MSYRSYALIAVILGLELLADWLLGRSGLTAELLGLPVQTWMLGLTVLTTGTVLWLARPVRPALRYAELAINSTNDGYWVLDAEGNFIDINDGYCRMMGHSREKIMSMVIADFEEVATQDRIRAQIQRILDKGNERFETRHRHADGHWVDLEITVTAVSSKYLVAFLRDVTERKLAQAEMRNKEELERLVGERTAELSRALQDARAATVAKSQFLAMMSHEIRTPMHGVVGIAELLLKTPLSEAQVGYVTSLLRAGTGLAGLLNDILDFSKIEAGRMELETTTLNPRMLLEETVALLEEQAKSKQLALKVLISPQVPELILGDPTRLRQVWLNLLSNAVKFTESGSVAVSLSVRFGEDDSLRLFSIVRDTGIGMSRQDMGNLFEPFGQADASTSRRFGGTGLGLVICKRLIEKMDGVLKVESEVGKGSSFSFEWPVKEIKGSGNSLADTAPGDLHQLDQLRILLVDDNALNRMLALGQFKELGHEDVKTANNGVEALEWLERSNFDVVFMDVQMPEMDGLEATRRLRAMPLDHQPVVVAMTANAYEEDRQNCIDAGMDHFLAKPVKLKTLREALTYARRA